MVFQLQDSKINFRKPKIPKGGASADGIIRELCEDGLLALIHLSQGCGTDFF